MTSHTDDEDDELEAEFNFADVGSIYDVTNEESDSSDQLWSKLCTYTKTQKNFENQHWLEFLIFYQTLQIKKSCFYKYV